MTNASKILNKIIPWCFAGYFLILFVERITSLVRIISDLANGKNPFADAFDIYVFAIAALSVVAAIVLLIIKNGGFFKSLVGKCTPDYDILTVISGVALVSGMVHTEYTIAPIQFGAYGILIAGMILETVITATETNQNKFKLWYSLAYITVFSMAIPVVYKSIIDVKTVFHTIEATVSLLLVLFFTVMLNRMFTGKGEDLLMLVPFIITIVGDAAIVVMNRSYEPNIFVLIFASVALVMFPIGKIIFGCVGKK